MKVSKKAYYYSIAFIAILATGFWSIVSVNHLNPKVALETPLIHDACADCYVAKTAPFSLAEKDIKVQISFF